MLSYQDALTTILSHVPSLPTEHVATHEAVGRCVAAPVQAPGPQPAFRNSSMDGYAVHWQDTSTATQDSPAALTRVGESAAGGAASLPALGPGTCVAIMTGGRLPDGATAIVPIEHTQQQAETILISSPTEDMAFVRPIGADWHTGDLICEAGQTVAVEHLPALFSHGLTTLAVKQRPKAAWISTGAELVDDLTQALGPTQIYNATGHFGRICLEQQGAILSHQATIGDSPDAFKTEVRTAKAQNVDLIISTGAVSVGAYDFIRQALEDMGAHIHLHRAKVRPGKPILCATFPDGPLFIGLPGNPVSTAMGFRMFICPILRRMLGQAEETPVKGILQGAVKAPGSLTVFCRAQVQLSGAGQLTAQVTPHQESYKTRSLLNANAWLVHPEGTEVLPDGAVVELYPLWPHGFRF